MANIMFKKEDSVGYIEFLMSEEDTSMYDSSPAEEYVKIKFLNLSTLLNILNAHFKGDLSDFPETDGYEKKPIALIDIVIHTKNKETNDEIYTSIMGNKITARAFINSDDKLKVYEEKLKTIHTLSSTLFKEN